MTLWISNDEIVSDLCPQVARRVGDRWVVSDRHGTYDRNQAITAMTIAEVHARGLVGTERYRRFMKGWEAELEDEAAGGGER